MKSLKEPVETARAAGFTEWDASGETALSFIANHICRRFGVSAEVIARRLRIEEFWPPQQMLHSVTVQLNTADGRR